MRIVWLANYPFLRLEPHLGMRRSIDGHPSSWVVNLAAALSRRTEIELHIVTVCPFVRRPKAFGMGDVAFHVLPSGVPFSDRGYPWYLPLDVACGFRGDRRRLVRAIEDIAPDIVHAFGTEGPYALAALDSSRPHMIHIQGVVAECRKAEPSLRLRLAERCETRAIRQGKWFSCRTAFDAGYVLSLNRTAWIANIQEAVHETFFHVHWDPRDDNSLLFVGAMKRRKGIEDLLTAVHLLKRQSRLVHLRMVGSGTARYQTLLRRRCRQLGIYDCVQFLGHRSSEEIARLHEQSQAFVLPSHAENSPNSVAEAMVAGVPVIASRVGGIPSMIRHLENGVLVEPKNPAALAQAIDRLLGDAAMRKRLSANARSVARVRHDAESIVRDTVAAYEQIACVHVAQPRQAAVPHAI